MPLAAGGEQWGVLESLILKGLRRLTDGMGSAKKAILVIDGLDECALSLGSLKAFLTRDPSCRSDSASAHRWQIPSPGLARDPKPLCLYQ